MLVLSSVSRNGYTDRCPIHARSLHMSGIRLGFPAFGIQTEKNRDRKGIHPAPSPGAGVSGHYDSH